LHILHCAVEKSLANEFAPTETRRTKITPTHQDRTNTGQLILL
jgi:hypothetical protein